MIVVFFVLRLFFNMKTSNFLLIILVVNRVGRAFSVLKLKPVTLVTFDVDGTLIHGSATCAEYSIHAKAFSHAVGSLFSEDYDTFIEQYPAPISVVPSKKYHGSTDGLIFLNFAKLSLNIPSENTMMYLPNAFQSMYEYVSSFTDDVVIQNTKALPQVIEKFKLLASLPKLKETHLFGLVTGNVEGIARIKMRACGITACGLLSKKAPSQNWKGEDEFSFLGGFGSDYCSGNIDDYTRNYKDRGEQICIAVKCAQSLLNFDQEIVRVIHVGDAPADIQAAKWCAEEEKFGSNITVGCIGVATGKFTAEELTELAGEPMPGKWEPVVLKNGIADDDFIRACGISVSE